jgi:integral membrane sensor domain MASE1
MKRFVVRNYGFMFRDFKSAAAAAVVVFLISVLIGASAGVIYLLCFGAIVVFALSQTRPDWLLRSPIGRWLRWRR